MKVRITFTEPVLGTIAGNKEIAAEFIVGRVLDRLTPAQRRQLFGEDAKQKELVKTQVTAYVLDGKELEGFPDDVEDLMAEELDAIKATEVLDKASTVFPRNDEGIPILWNYQCKGQLKGACEIMQGRENHPATELKSHRLTPWTYKKTIDTLIHIRPRQIPLVPPNSCDLKNLPFVERPLRASTMKGERVCLARSESLPVGTSAELEIELWNDKLLPYVKEWLGYGESAGMLQWRSGGWGTFTWQELP